MEEKGPYSEQPQWSAAQAAQQQNQEYPPVYQQNSRYPQAPPQNPGYPPAAQYQNPGYAQAAQQPNLGYPPSEQQQPPVYTSAQQQNAPIPAQQYPGYPPPQPNVVIVTQSPSYPTAQNNVPPQTNTADNRRNRPQGNSVVSASLIFMSGGMNIAWSFGFGSIFPLVLTHLRISWFIGAIIGAILGSIAAKFLQKKYILIVSALLVTLGGILFTADQLNIDAMVAARYLDGIANGFAFAPTLMMVGEEVVKRNRGANAASVEALAVSTGIFVQLLFASVWGYMYIGYNDAFGATRTHGVFCIVFGVVALFGAVFLTIESPVFHLERNDEQAAIDCLRRLQRPAVVTQETYSLLEENKLYVAKNNEMSVMAAAVAGLPALLKLCIYRGLAAMGFSYFMSLTIIVSSTSLLSSLDFIWPFLVYGGVRWLGAIISMFVVDSGGRKMPMLVATIICAGMAIGTGVIYDDGYDIYISAYLLFVFQFFASFFTSSSSAYLSEAFPLAVKPFYLSIVFIVEMLVQIIIGICTVEISGITSYFYALGSMSFVFLVLAIVSMPETKRNTLLDAQAKFRSFTHVNFN